MSWNNLYSVIPLDCMRCGAPTKQRFRSACEPCADDIQVWQNAKQERMAELERERVERERLAKAEELEKIVRKRKRYA